MNRNEMLESLATQVNRAVAEHDRKATDKEEFTAMLVLLKALNEMPPERDELEEYKQVDRHVHKLIEAACKWRADLLENYKREPDFWLTSARKVYESTAYFEGKDFKSRTYDVLEQRLRFPVCAGSTVTTLEVTRREGESVTSFVTRAAKELTEYKLTFARNALMDVVG